MRKITAEEIEELYRFTRRHYVEYFDVQTELVDHLASAIDENWVQEPELSFNENLNREFRKFGVYGFSDVVAKKERAMEKRYLKLIWEEVKSLLKLPKTLLSVGLLFSTVFVLLGIRYGAFIFLGLMFGYCIFLMILFSRQSSLLKKKKRKGESFFLLEALILNAGRYFSVFWFPFYIFQFSGFPDSLLSLYIRIPAALFISFLLLFSYICYIEVPGKKDEILQKVYPERKFSF